jgi:gliding motility-associated-like protein
MQRQIIVISITLSQLCKYAGKRALVLAFIFLFSLKLSAQVPLWAHHFGSTTGDDRSWVSRKGPNGTILLGGTFKGTMDIDPSPAVYNLTSNGQEDFFVACFDTAGSFIWAFSVGGAGMDVAQGLAVDSLGNVYLSGWFRGANVDFDPSTTGTAFLSENGNSVGSTWPWGGDIFVAKYTSTGAYQWAFSMGDASQYDLAPSIAVDPAGYIYVGGNFHGTIDINPSPTATTNILSGNGTGFLIKYSNSGQLVRGITFGKGGYSATDNQAEVIKVDNYGNVYMAGYFQGINNDFDFSPTATALLSSTGGDEAYVAKYDTAFNYQFAVSFGTTIADYVEGIDIDASGNVYVTGATYGTSIDFDPSPATAIMTAPGAGPNMFVAKYSATGQYVWAKLLGGSGSDHGYDVGLNANNVFCTGYFSGTVDFDSSPAIANLTSAGQKDVYVVRYDLAGNYVCSFSAGSTGNDIGTTILSSSNDQIYLAGEFAGTNVDFDPSSTSTLNLSSNGFLDLFFAKYNWMASGAVPNGTLAGDTVCQGQQAYLTYTSSTGPGPFTITYTNGTSTYTQVNVMSSVPFALSTTPSSTTTYTLQQVIVPGICGSVSTSVNSNASVLVNPLPTVNAGADISLCSNTLAQLSGSGAGTLSWAPPTALNNSNIGNPTVLHLDTTMTFILTATGGSGCVSSDTMNFTIRPQPIADAGPDTSLCEQTLYQLQGSGAGNYQWLPSAGLSNPSVTNPVFTAANTTQFYFTVTNQYGCSNTDQVTITVNPLPVANAGNDTTVCSGSPFSLHGSGGASYSWYPSANMVGANTPNPTVTLNVNTAFYVIASTTFGCKDTDNVAVIVLPEPVFNVSPSHGTICSKDSVSLMASGGDDYAWYPTVNITSTSTASTIVFPESTTTYYVLITEDQCNRKDSLPVVITIAPQPDVTISKSNDLDCDHISAMLSAEGGFKYTWSPSAGLDNTASGNVIATPSVSTTYTVIGEELYGCKDTATINLDVKFEGGGKIFLSDAFTPNNDGRNDCWRARLISPVSSFEMSIFNRWGERVFHSADPTQCWDGSYKGVLQPVGTFYYFYKADTKACGQLSGKGNIELIR